MIGSTIRGSTSGNSDAFLYHGRDSGTVYGVSSGSKSRPDTRNCSKSRPDTRNCSKTLFDVKHCSKSQPDTGIVRKVGRMQGNVRKVCPIQGIVRKVGPTRGIMKSGLTFFGKKGIVRIVRKKERSHSPLYSTLIGRTKVKYITREIKQRVSPIRELYLNHREPISGRCRHQIIKQRKQQPLSSRVTRVGN